jgi:hypothetical protein
VGAEAGEVIRRFYLAAATSLSIAAAPPPPAPDAAPAHVRADVEFLADDLLEGRDTGSRGHAIAAAFVASRFRALGLQPGGTSGGWYRQVPLRTATLAGPPPAAELLGPRSRRRLDIGRELIVGAHILEQRQDVTAPLVFAGYGISSPAMPIDDYRGLDVRGKIAVVLEGSPPDLSSEVAAHLEQAKAEMAARNGAIGVIVVGTPSSSRSPLWSYRLRSGTRPLTHWVDPSGRSGSLPAGARLSLVATEQGGDAVFSGAARSFGDVAAEADRGGRPRGFALPLRLHLTRTSQWRDFTSPEVIGVLPGSDPRLAGQPVMMMGHLDHLGIKADARGGEDAIYNGALDNAAGVATLLEAARMFVQSGRPPRHPVMFIANTGEEKGLLGADYLAAHPPVPLSDIVAVVDLDMPVLLYDFTDVIAFGAEHSTVARTVADAAAGMQVRVSPDPMPQESIFVRSDHYRFVLRGVPAILLMTGYANGGEPIWRRFLSSIYHTPRDDLSQPIDWRAGAKYGELNYRIARALADEPQRPRWYRGDFFGDSFAPGQPRAEPRP